jgi:hypothetical protein
VADGLIYVGCCAKKLYCIDGKEGRKVWDFQTGNIFTFFRGVESSPVFQTVIFISDVMTEAFTALIQGKEELLQEALSLVRVINFYKKDLLLLPQTVIWCPFRRHPQFF